MKPVTIAFDFYIACIFKDLNLYLERATRIFYNQHQTEIAKKNKQKLNNILRLSFWQTCPKKFVCIDDVILLIVKKMIMVTTK